MAKRITGKNREAAKFLGIAPEKFVDPGFCLGCGESNCQCDGPRGIQADTVAASPPPREGPAVGVAGVGLVNDRRTGATE